MKSNLDWSKIDNEKIFQRLSNHLFLLEVNRTYFIPSSPYIGADGGWDGRYGARTVRINLNEFASRAVR